MAQVPKAHVREGFVEAAAAAFAELGYAATTMARVAERARSSVGNLYKYFSSKEQLFSAAVPSELVRELKRRTRARIRALGSAKDTRELAPNAEYHALAGDLLDFCLAHRAAVVILLARAESTPFAAFSAEFTAELVEWALQYAGIAYPGLEETPELRFVLEHAYASFLSAVGEALLRFSEEPQLRRVIAQLTSHHQAGLKRSFEVAFEARGGKHANPRHTRQPSVVEPAAKKGARYSGALAPSSSAAGARARRADRTRRAGGRG
jgi:AcrR family transcriptional regulator